MATTLTIDFHGDPLLVIRDDDCGDLVPLRPLVKGMGLDWSAQRRRVYRHPVMAKAVAIMATGPSDPEGLCLPLHLVPGFLFGVTAEKITEEAIRAKVIEYQEGCFRTLAEACFGVERPAPRAPKPEPTERVPTKLALRMVAEARHTFDQQAGREIWFLSGLPVTRSMREQPAQGSLFTYTAERTGGRT